MQCLYGISAYPECSLISRAIRICKAHFAQESASHFVKVHNSQ